jgi:hypothetical protein
MKNMNSGRKIIRKLREQTIQIPTVLTSAYHLEHMEQTSLISRPLFWQPAKTMCVTCIRERNEHTRTIINENGWYPSPNNCRKCPFFKVCLNCLLEAWIKKCQTQWRPQQTMPGTRTRDANVKITGVQLLNNPPLNNPIGTVHKQLFKTRRRLNYDMNRQMCHKTLCGNIISRWSNIYLWITYFV